ncbi:Dolichyl-phosphate-mannose-protein mannosyltransferase [Pseudobutyrivibrio sp. UC1225]|uniref:glycosyltransferase family 39 protein n=1 Tax=Pseudobutyrivibrio sp. UC1225 TaxID=1798185 RepID=UPI0008EC3C23|nr:glycosyltransferase family 39 protein [Pseudobutyrivibrio sp. UC1225]SFN96505.1 Dolichyl-phosphate-mannose-protein mannosyltransferase [Pseudobutyrivibrio sp. UC1225]
MSKIDRRFIVILLLISTVLTLFFTYRKMDYNVDEVWTFGLANNIGSICPDIEFGKKYSGEGFYKDFMEVSPENTFNYGNVLSNQANDVHPPLYYFFIHTICSIFKDSYSLWYGIAVNIFWMFLIIPILYLLGKELTHDSRKTFGFILAYTTSMAFMDTVLLIRMYAQFTFFTILLAYLFKKYWDKTLDKGFYPAYFVITILGMLSHYYFVIFLFFISLAFGIHLILEKKYKELRNCILTACGSAVVYLLLWHHIFNHIFRGGRGRQALSSAASIDVTSIIFAIIAIISLAVVIKRGKEKYTYSTALLLCGLLYVLVVLKVAPFYSFRYWMPIVFIPFYLVFDIVDSIIVNRTKTSYRKYVSFSVFLLINIISFAALGFHTSKDFYSREYEKLLSNIEGKDCIFYIEEDWEALCYFVPAQKASSYIFVNPDTLDLVKDMDESYIFSTRYENLDKIEINKDMKPIYNPQYALQYYEVNH